MMPKHAEEHPLNYRADDYKHTKSIPTRTTIHLGRDCNGTNDMDLNINTNFTINRPKMYKIFVACTLLAFALIIIIGSFVFVFLCNELKSLKTEMVITEQTFQRKFEYIKQSQNALSFDSFTHNTNDLHPVQEAQKDTNKDPDHSILSRKKQQDGESALESINILRNSAIAHFIGAIPEIALRENGPIGPWFMDNSISSPSVTDNFDLSVDAKSVIINKEGIYFIYAQMKYLTKLPSCYFVLSRDSDHRRKILAQCCTGSDSTPFNGPPGEMTCSVNTVTHLKRKDSVFLVQREKNRTFSMDEGASSFGFITLS